MLAKVHVAKKQIGLEDAAYRDVVLRVTGRDSAGACSDGQLVALLTEFRRLGFADAPASNRSGKTWVRLIYAIWSELRPLLEDADDQALNGFVARQTRSAKNPTGIARPEWLDPQEARKVIEGLKGWLARVREGSANA